MTVSQAPTQSYMTTPVPALSMPNPHLMYPVTTPDDLHQVDLCVTSSQMTVYTPAVQLMTSLYLPAHSAVLQPITVSQLLTGPLHPSPVHNPPQSLSLAAANESGSNHRLW